MHVCICEKGYLDKTSDVLHALSLDISNYLHPFNYTIIFLCTYSNGNNKYWKKHMMIAILLPIFLSYNFP